MARNHWETSRYQAKRECLLSVVSGLQKEVHSSFINVSSSQRPLVHETSHSFLSQTPHCIKYIQEI